MRGPLFRKENTFLIIVFFLLLYIISVPGVYAARVATEADCKALSARGITCEAGKTLLKTADEVVLSLPGQGQSDAYEFLLKRLLGKPASHVKGFNPEFAKRLASFINAAEKKGYSIKINSGFRSRAHQASLWENAKRKYKSESVARQWVAPPGNSTHERGIAADLQFNGKSFKEISCARNPACVWAHAEAQTHGLYFRLSHEPWHIEPSGSVPGQSSPYIDRQSPTREAVNQLMNLFNPTAQDQTPRADPAISSIPTTPGVSASQVPLGSVTPILRDALTDNDSAQNTTANVNDNQNTNTNIIDIGSGTSATVAVQTGEVATDTPATQIERIAESLENEVSTTSRSTRIINVPLPQAENVMTLLAQQNLEVRDIVYSDNGAASIEVQLREPDGSIGISGFVGTQGDTFAGVPQQGGAIERLCTEKPWLGVSITSVIVSPIFDGVCARLGHEIFVGE